MRWPDLDLERRIWRPTLSVQRPPGELDPATGGRTGRLVAKELKSQASSQPIALPRSIVEALEKWRAEQLGVRMHAVRWVNPDLVFTTTVGTALEPRNVNRQWEKVCAKAGTRKIRLHDIPTAAADAMDGVLVTLRSQGAGNGSGVPLRSALRSTADRSVSEGQPC